MAYINKFYLQQAEYQVEIDGEEVGLLLNYAGNTYEVVGKASEKVVAIATQLLSKKHGVNFAYKFNDKIGDAL